MNTSALWAELDTSIRQDIINSQSLLTLLQQEKIALEQRDYPSLETFIHQKKQLLSSIKQSGNYRGHSLQSAGFKDEQSALQQAEREAPNTANAWHQLVELWQECQHLNKVNEHIMQRTKLVVSKTLDLLRGANNQQKLYDTKGMASSTLNGRSITSA